MLRLLCLLVVATLSGCVGDDGPKDPADEQVRAEAEDELAFNPPAWALGDWWTFRDNDGDERTWVVTEAGNGYTVDIDAGDLAFMDAAFSDVSTIGNINAELDGVQDGTPVEFFAWPLIDGSTWELQWDGLPFVATASVTAEEATVEAISGNTERTYVYDEATRWFSSIESRVNGTVDWSLELVSSGQAYAGTYVRYEIHDEQRFTFDPATGQQEASELQVPETATDVWYDLDLTCVAANAIPGAIHYALQPPSPTTKGLVVSSACPVTIDSTETLEVEAGTWRTALDVRGVQGTITVIVRTLHEYTL